MKVNITARHLELTPALREYAEKKIGHVSKFTDRITNGQIVLNVEKDRHIAEVTIAVARNKINAKAIAGDMYAAIDLVLDKIVKQLKRHLEKMKDHKVNLAYMKAANLAWNETEVNEVKIKGTESELDEIKELRIKEQTVREAIKTIEERELSFWIFREIKDNTINIIFKKDDGTNGMLVVR